MMARRRANGEGTIYRRPEGRYAGAAYFLTTSGKHKRKWVYGKTRAEVHEKLTAVKMQAQRGIPIPDQTWKLGAYLEYWLEQVVKPTKRPTTYAQCETVTRLYLNPGLGKSALTQLSVPVVQSFLNGKLDEGHSLPKVQVMRKVLSSALTNAMRNELVVRNVARLAVLPSYESGEITPWSADEARRFLTTANTDPLYPAFVLLMLYGLRRGEVLGLRWQDIDFDWGVIHIRQQLQRVRGVLYQAPVKTKAGRRDLPLLSFAGNLLILQRSAQQAAYAARIGVGSADELVFTSKSGRPIEPRNFSRSFIRLCKQHGLQRIRMHDVRHTTATLLKDLGVPARDVQLILGHAHISTTQQIYQHANMEGRREGLGRLELVLKQATAESQRCRQELPSGPRYTRLLKSVQSVKYGAQDESRTRDPFLTISIHASLSDRIASINLVLRGHRRLWLLGCVAVNYSRQTVLGMDGRPPQTGGAS